MCEPVKIPFTRDAIPASIEGMTEAQRDELAQSYLNLFGNLVDALNECDHDYGFFWFNGRGIESSGHVPSVLMERLTGHE